MKETMFDRQKHLRFTNPDLSTIHVNERLHQISQIFLLKTSYFSFVRTLIVYFQSSGKNCVNIKQFERYTGELNSFSKLKKFHELISKGN